MHIVLDSEDIHKAISQYVEKNFYLKAQEVVVECRSGKGVGFSDGDGLNVDVRVEVEE